MLFQGGNHFLLLQANRCFALGELVFAPDDACLHAVSSTFEIKMPHPTRSDEAFITSCNEGCVYLMLKA